MNYLKLDKDEFENWLKDVSFEKAGDKFEQQYCSYLQTEFPRLEEFWKKFVVPLTNRLGESKVPREIQFRDGVDSTLQFICGANYSLFIHLTYTKIILTKWDDTSLAAIYTRLASAFDVFEALAIKLHLLLCDCRQTKSLLLSGLSEEQFLQLAREYYQKEYSKLFELYLKVGKNPPPIKIPTKGDILNEYFKGNIHWKKYQQAGEIRAFRNAIVHDVRVGMLEMSDGSILVPKPSVISKYRQWSAVEEASKDGVLIAKDFCEVKTQCANDVTRVIKILNDLYGFLLADFEGEFAKNKKLRDLFGIEFDTGSKIKLVAVGELDMNEDSSSYKNADYSAAHNSGTHSISPKQSSETTFNVGVSGVVPQNYLNKH